MCPAKVTRNTLIELMHTTSHMLVNMVRVCVKATHTLSVRGRGPALADRGSELVRQCW